MLFWCFSVEEFKAKVTGVLFFFAMLKVFWYFICFVLCKSHWKTKQRTALACCLCSRSLISGCFRGSCFFVFVFFAALYTFDLAGFVFTVQLCERSHYDPVLCGWWISILDIDCCVSDNAVCSNHCPPWARRPSEVNEQFFFFNFQAAFMPLDSLSLEKKIIWKVFMIILH